MECGGSAIGAIQTFHHIVMQSIILFGLLIRMECGSHISGKGSKLTLKSYINDSFDGPTPPCGVEGDKLTSTISITSNTDSENNLLSVDVKSNYDVKETGGLSMFKGRDYFPGLGPD